MSTQQAVSLVTHYQQVVMKLCQELCLVRIPLSLNSDPGILQVSLNPPDTVRDPNVSLTPSAGISPRLDCDLYICFILRWWSISLAMSLDSIAVLFPTATHLFFL